MWTCITLIRPPEYSKRSSDNLILFAHLYDQFQALIWSYTCAWMASWHQLSHKVARVHSNYIFIHLFIFWQVTLLHIVYYPRPTVARSSRNPASARVYFTISIMILWRNSTLGNAPAALSESSLLLTCNAFSAWVGVSYTQHFLPLWLKWLTVPGIERGTPGPYHIYYKCKILWYIFFQRQSSQSNVFVAASF